MRREAPHNEVMDVLVDCWRVWSKNHVSESKIDEMSDELEQHLEEARRDGKSVENVVGPDVETFARDWAAEHEAEQDWSPEPLWRRVEGWLLGFTIVTAVSVLIFHLSEWSLYIPVAWPILCYVTVLIFWLFAPALEWLGKTWSAPWWRGWIMAIFVVLPLFVLTLGLNFIISYSRSTIPVDWPWYATLVVAAVPVIIISRWTRESG